MYTGFILYLAVMLSTQAVADGEGDPLLGTADLSRPVGPNPYVERTVGQRLSVNTKLEPEPAESVHILIIADENAAGIGEAVHRDRIAIKELFKRGFANEPNWRQIAEIPERDLTPQKAVRRIASLQLGPRDTLVVYFSGHGELETTNEVVGQIPVVGGARNVFRSVPILRLDDQRLARANVRSAMERTGARLMVLFTDCCRPAPRGVNPVGSPRDPGLQVHPALDTTKVNKKHLQDLFVFQSGFVDISTREALSDPAHGGVLTHCFVAACCYYQQTFTYQVPAYLRPKMRGPNTPALIDRNHNSFLEWSEVIPLWCHLIREFSGSEQVAVLDIY
jgi:Caspase domain